MVATCPTPFDALRIATENLPDDIYRKASWFSIWLSYIQRGAFPKNTGVNQTTFVIGNSEPITNTESWTNVTLSNNQITTMCSSSYTDIDVGYTELTYTPKRFGIAGPVICKETLGFAHNPKQFLAQYMREMVKRAKRSWEFEFRNTFMAAASKIIARPSFDIVDGTTTFPQVAATSQLTQDILDYRAADLIQQGATDADQDLIELGEDGPIFPLLIGLEAIQRLSTNVTARRDDTRYADMGKGQQAELMRRIGATRILRNYRIIPEVLPPRFSFTPGVGYTQIPTFEMVATTEGTVARITSAYKSAVYEGAIQLHPLVFKAMMVSPDGAGLDWQPTNYMGEWVWKTGGDISTTYCFDPLKKYGRHFAEFMYAPNVIYSNFGTTFIFKRCPNDITTAACTYA